MFALKLSLLSMNKLLQFDMLRGIFTKTIFKYSYCLSLLHFLQLLHHHRQVCTVKQHLRFTFKCLSGNDTISVDLIKQLFLSHNDVRNVFGVSLMLIISVKIFISLFIASIFYKVTIKNKYVFCFKMFFVDFPCFTHLN